MAESEKISKNYLSKDILPFSKGVLVITRDKTDSVVSVCVCYGLTVIHARENGTTLYHLGVKSDCPAYMAGIARRSVENGFEVSWGYSDHTDTTTLLGLISLGNLTETTRKPRVFNQYHLGGDTERFNPTGAPAPTQQVSVGDNLLDLLGIEDAQGDASNASTPSHCAQTPSAPQSATEAIVAPHRRIVVGVGDARSYLASLEA